MLLTTEEISTLRFGITWVVIMVLLAHWYLIRSRRKVGIICIIISVCIASAIIGIYIKNERNYDVMVMRITNINDLLL